jgi:hypothetical protein
MSGFLQGFNILKTAFFILISRVELTKDFTKTLLSVLKIRVCHHLKRTLSESDSKQSIVVSL